MADQAQQAVVMNIPEALVQAHIRAAVAQVLTANDPGILIERLVTAVLTTPSKENGWNDKRSALDKEIEKMIVEVAIGAAKEWMKEQEPKIRAAVRKRFDAGKSNVIATLCDKFVDAMMTSLHVSISMEEVRSK